MFQKKSSKSELTSLSGLTSQMQAQFSAAPDDTYGRDSDVGNERNSFNVTSKAFSDSASPSATAISRLPSNENPQLTLAHLTETGQFAPAIKAVVDHQWVNSFSTLLDKSIIEREGHISDISRANYAALLSSVQGLSHIREDARAMCSRVLELNRNITKSGETLLERSHQLQRAKLIRMQINQTISVLESSVNLVEATVYATDQVSSNRFYSALRNLDEMSRKAIPPFAAFSIEQSLRPCAQSLANLVKFRVKQHFITWLAGVRLSHRPIGSTSLEIIARACLIQERVKAFLRRARYEALLEDRPVETAETAAFLKLAPAVSRILTAISDSLRHVGSLQRTNTRKNQDSGSSNTASSSNAKGSNLDPSQSQSQRFAGASSNRNSLPSPSSSAQQFKTRPASNSFSEHSQSSPSNANATLEQLFNDRIDGLAFSIELGICPLELFPLLAMDTWTSSFAGTLGGGNLLPRENCFSLAPLPASLYIPDAALSTSSSTEERDRSGSGSSSASTASGSGSGSNAGTGTGTGSGNGSGPTSPLSGPNSALAFTSCLRIASQGIPQLMMNSSSSSGSTSASPTSDPSSPSSRSSGNKSFQKQSIFARKDDLQRKQSVESSSSQSASTNASGTLALALGIEALELLHGLNFGALHQCLHIFSAVGQESRFAHTYRERRHAQALQVVEASASFTINGFLWELAHLLADLSGYFSVERHVLRHASSVVTFSQFESAWAGTTGISHRLRTVFLRQLTSVTTPSVFLELKALIILFARVIESLGLSAMPLLEVCSSFADSFSSMLATQFRMSVSQVFRDTFSSSSASNGVIDQYIARSKAQYENEITFFGLGPEKTAVVTFPYYLSFSPAVPAVARLILHLLQQSLDYMSNLPNANLHFVLQNAESALGEVSATFIALLDQISVDKSGDTLSKLAKVLAYSVDCEHFVLVCRFASCFVQAYVGNRPTPKGGASSNGNSPTSSGSGAGSNSSSNSSSSSGTTINSIASDLKSGLASSDGFSSTSISFNLNASSSFVQMGNVCQDTAFELIYTQVDSCLEPLLSMQWAPLEVPKGPSAPMLATVTFLKAALKLTRRCAEPVKDSLIYASLRHAVTTYINNLIQSSHSKKMNQLGYCIVYYDTMLFSRLLEYCQANLLLTDSSLDDILSELDVICDIFLSGSIFTPNFKADVISPTKIIRLFEKLREMDGTLFPTPQIRFTETASTLMSKQYKNSRLKNVTVQTMHFTKKDIDHAIALLRQMT